MKERFEGERGGQLLLETLVGNKMIAGDRDLAAEFLSAGELVEYRPGDVVIEQGDFSNEVYLIVAGLCTVIINGRLMANRGAGDHVGEMAAIQPTQARSATVIAAETTVALKVAEKDFSRIASAVPHVFRLIAQELSRRLLQRNEKVGAFHEKIKVFIISSVEALPVARIVRSAFEHDPFQVELWSDGCFKVANYTIEDLENAVSDADFAVAIAHADDVTESRDDRWPAPRDNVIFELGLFMGRLGRARAVLMEPRNVDVKLPSDLAGITTIPYRFERGGNNAALMGPACDRLRSHINALGPNNG